jgi:ribosomal protein S4E
LKQESAIPLILLVDVFLGFAQNSFEMQHAATCRFCENTGNVLTNRKEGINIQKRIVNALQAFKRVL